MAKLFPPLIDGVIPAFYKDGNKIHITIPFSLNRTVSPTQIQGIIMKIKTTQSSTYLFTVEQRNTLYYQLDNSPQVDFYLEDNGKLKVGQFYKIQIAFIGESEIGYYSTVGIGKYTTKPSVFINDFENNFSNTHNYKYTGIYSQENGDISERVYFYRFDVYDNENNIIMTSGNQLHNSSNDVENYESYDDFMLTYDLIENMTYRIKYTVTTVNGMTISTPRYKIVQRATINPEIQAALEAILNYDNGFIDIQLIGEKDDQGLETPVSGAFLLSRASEDSNYMNWDEISRFQMTAQTPSRDLWQDFTVEQGKNYKYSLQQYNDSGLYSNRIISNEVYTNFEDTFLYDGERQLKVRYNTKISSFKATVLEAKMDTIGGQYPFILRNGRTYYREFPISGLISYQMDEDNQFFDHSSYNPATNLTSENLNQEREFKLKVYEWLNNGEPKLFRSPTEGNYIVRLMNVSLTPNDTLGRMIHTFNATAYEVADFNYDNLSSYNFIKLQDPNTKTMRWETVDFTKKDENGKVVYRTGEILNNYPVQTVRFIDMMPGDKVTLIYENGDIQEIQIGITGSYYVDLGVPIKGIQLGENTQLVGSMVYGYYSTQENEFNKIIDVVVDEIPLQQFIGEHDVIKEITYVYDKDKKQWIKNPKLDILSFLEISAQKRNIEKITAEDTFKPDSFTLYAYGQWVEEGAYNPSRKNLIFKLEKYKDLFNNKEYLPNEYQALISIDNSQISVEDTRDFTLSNPGAIAELKSGNGTVVNVAYRLRTIDFSIENTNREVLQAKKEYNNLLTYLNSLIKNLNGPENEEVINEIEDTRQALQDKYTNYILTLVEAQRLEKEAEGNV